MKKLDRSTTNVEALRAVRGGYLLPLPWLNPQPSPWAAHNPPPVPWDVYKDNPNPSPW